MTWSVMSIARCSLMAPICGGGAATRRLADVRSASAAMARDAATTVLRILHLRELWELYEIRRVPQERLALSSPDCAREVVADALVRLGTGPLREDETVVVAGQ